MHSGVETADTGRWQTELGPGYGGVKTSPVGGMRSPSGRQLAPWAILQHFDCALVERRQEVCARVAFKVQVHLTSLIRGVMGLDADAGVVRLKVHGTSDGFDVAGKRVFEGESAWFCARLQLVPQMDALGISVRELYWFGPKPAHRGTLRALMPRPVWLEPDAQTDPDFLIVRPLPLLIGALKNTVDLHLPGPALPLSIRAHCEGDRLRLEAQAYRPEMRVLENPRPTPNHIPVDPTDARICRTALHQAFDHALASGHWEDARALLTQAEQLEPWVPHGFSQLVQVCPDLSPAEVARVRRLAHQGELAGLCAMVAIHLRVSRHLQARFWYERLRRVASDHGGLVAWAASQGDAAHQRALMLEDSPLLEDDTVSRVLPPAKAAADEARVSPILKGSRGGSPPASSGSKDPELPVLSPSDLKPSPSAEEALAQYLHDGVQTAEQLAAVRAHFEADEDWRGLLEVLEVTLEHASEPDVRTLLHRELAQVKLALGVPSRAVFHYEEILAAVPDDDDAIAFLRRQYEKQGDHEARIRLEVGQVTTREETDPSHSLRTLAEDARIHELFDLERDLLIRACGVNPMDRALLDQVTGLLERHEDWDTLLELWTARLPILTHVADKVETGLKIATLLDVKGDLDGAERVYRGLLRSDPEHPEILDGLAKVLGAKGNWTGAVSMLEQRTRQVSGEDRVQVALRLAEIYASDLDDQEAADSWYREAVAEMPENPQASEGLIRHLEKRGDWPALVCFLEGHMDVVEDPEARYDLLEFIGDIYAVRLRDHAQAQAYFLEAESLARAIQRVETAQGVA